MMQADQQQPDTQGKSKNGLEGDLPMGESTQGMEGNVTDGASMTKGYSIVGNDVVNAPPPMPRDGFLEPVPVEEREGFAGRAEGWER